MKYSVVLHFLLYSTSNTLTPHIKSTRVVSFLFCTFAEFHHLSSLALQDFHPSHSCLNKVLSQLVPSADYSLSLIFKKINYVYLSHAIEHMSRPKANFGSWSSSFTKWVWELNSGREAWQQVALSTEPSCEYSIIWS